MQLHEKYRPRTWSDVIGQDKVIARVQALAKRGLAGRAYWLSGQSGTGKSSIARLIAAEVADEFSTQELDAAALSVADLQQLERDMNVRGWGDKAGRAYLVNEAHALRKPVIRQLLVLLERLPAHVCIIFTTTTDGQDSLFEDYDDASPLLSRCTVLELARRNLAEAFAERCRSIAEREGFPVRPFDWYLKLIQKHRQNLRAALQEIESFELVAA